MTIVKTPDLSLTVPDPMLDEGQDAYRGPRSGMIPKRGNLPPLTPQDAVSTPVWTVRLLLIGAGLVVLGLAIWGVW